ncbi:MAG TPA: DUF4340 domain-containing protein [Verrucomicrobiae bacterium]|nr:DUF4340 domain-containing protein [Verrucomicrobiae bacterium]
MRFRNTFLAAAVLAALASWIYFYEYRGEEGRQKVEAAKKKLLDFDPNVVAGLELVRPDGAIRVAKDGETWRLTSPVEARADGEEVQGLLSTLSWLETDRKLEASPDDLGAYKLAPPALKIVVKRGSGGLDLTLLVGDKAAVGSAYYARRGESGDVVTTSTSIDRLLQATADKLRYKKVVGVDSWKISRFTISRGGAAVAFAKAGEEWRIESPIAFPADRAKVSNLLFDASAIAAEGFEAAGTTPEGAGLAHPETTLSLTDRDGKTIEIAFSAKDPNGIVRAKRADLPEIFKVKGETVDKLSVVVADYRDVRIAPLDRYQLTEIRAATGGSPTALVKDGESVWHAGGISGPAASSKAVDDFLTALEAARAASFIDAPAASGRDIGPPALTLKLKAKDVAAPVELKIGSLASAKVLVSSSAAPAIYELDRSLADNLVKSASALGARPADAASAADAKPASGRAETPKPGGSR